jgi:excisionase family DNA binding protein
MADISSDLISTTIGDFCRLSGIGRSRVYELLDAGTLESVKIGKRRLILIDSYRKLIDHQRVAPSSAKPAIAAAAG